MNDELVKKWWYENNRLLCWSGCVSCLSWEEVEFMHDEIKKIYDSATTIHEKDKRMG